MIIKCKDCGNEIENNVTECPFCGCMTNARVEENITDQELNVATETGNAKLSKNNKIIAMVAIAIVLIIALIIGIASCNGSSDNDANNNVDYNDVSDDNNNDYDNNNNNNNNFGTTDIQRVEYISNRKLQDNDDKGYVFLFSFLDQNEKEMKSAATIKLRIVNDAGATVYTSTKNVTESDFSTWSNRISGQSWLQAAIYINFSEITKGTAEKGRFYYQITSASGVSFDEFDLSIDGLPVKGASVTMPSLPKIIHDYDYSNSIETSVKITNIRYEISGDDLYLYFTGEKTYDDEGSKYSRSCNVGWKLYDADGYIIDSGTFYSPAIRVGEKFRDEKEYVWDAIRPGESYKLVIENVD